MLKRRAPQRLYVRLIGLVVAVTMLGALVSAAITQARLTAKSRAAIETQAAALAQSAASAAAQDLLLKDFASLEAQLGQLAQLPAIDSIAVLDASGREYLAWRRRESGAQPQLDYTRATAAAPDTKTATLSSNDAAVIAWHPMDAAGIIGWIRVEHSLSQERSASRSIWINSLLTSFAVALALVAVLALYLRTALMPLERAAKFAKSLAQRPGTTFSTPGSSQEIQALGDALNDASLRLKANYDAIMQRDAELHAVLNTAGDAIIALDARGRIRMCNPAAASAFGLEPDQTMFRHIETLLPALTLDRVAQLTASAVSTGSAGMKIARTEITGLRNGGTEFPTEVSLSEVNGSASLRYALVVRDVTEKRMADDHLRIYVNALENSSSGIVICDARIPGAPMMYANAAFTRITGYSSEESIGRSCSFLQGNDRDQPEVAALRAAMANGTDANVTLRNYRKDGTLFWNQLTLAPVVDETGALTHFVGAVNDITARVVAEQATARRRAQLDLILQLSPDGFVLFDRLDRLAYASPAFCRMTGLSADELAARVTPEVLDGTLRALADPKTPWPNLWNGISQPQELVLMQPERRILMAQVEHNGTTGDRLLFVRDVTRESEVDRMKSEFLSTAAHELRTPMVSIFGFAELLLNRNYPPERVKSMLQTVHRQAGLIVNLINELLDLARIEARQGKDFHLETQALQPIVAEAIAGLLVPNDTRKVELNMPSEPLWVSVDKDKLRQALNNVLSNAYKYSPKGGRIALDIEVNDTDHIIAVRVSDRGIGMTQEQLARVFERFYRADPSGNIPGTGLGLCIVKEIIELQGGRVDVQSTSGEGTCVTLHLPTRSTPAAARVADAEVTAG